MQSRRRFLTLAVTATGALLAACAAPAAPTAPPAKPTEAPKPTTAPVQPAAPTAPAPAATTAPVAKPSAAAAPATPVAAAPAKAGAVTDLVFWTTSSGIIQQLTTEYAKANSINIAYQQQGNYDQMVQKVQAGIAANSLPHMAILGQRHGIPQMADSGKLIPLADFLKDDKSFGEEDFLPSFWKKFSYKGRVQTSPFINSSPVLHYNRTAFKEAGLNPDQPPANWVELASAAKALTIRDGSTVKQWGITTADDTPWYAYALIWQNGGSLMSDAGKPAFADEAGVGALQYWKDLVHIHKVMAPLQHKDSEKDFTAGKVAMTIQSSASTGALEKSIGDKFDYGVARFPGNKMRAVPVGGASLGIFKSDTAREQASWALIKWFTSPEINARISRETGYLAIRNKTLELPDMKDYLAKNPRRALAIQQIREDIRAEGVNPADAVIWLGLGKVQEKLESDASADPKKLLSELADETAKYLKDY